MTMEYIKDVISECCNDVLFTYNGKESGITSEVHNSVSTFQIWYGNFIKEYSSLMDALSDKVFGGKSFIQLFEENRIEIEFA